MVRAMKPAQAAERSIGDLLEIRMLGGVEFRVNGVEISAQAWTTRRARELVLLVALSRQHRLTRDEVVDALWPQLDGDAGGANLRKAAHFARQALGLPDALALREGRAALLPTGTVVTDVVRFEQAADTALTRGGADECGFAADLYAGDLLPDAPYEPWLEAARVRLRGKFLRLLRAAGRMEQLAHEEPSDEQAHQALMRQALAAGHRPAAIRWYGRLRNALERELGVAPSPETETLYASCVAGLAAAEPVLLGRDVELARARDALSDGTAQVPAGLVVQGAAGIGKTAFCQRLCALAKTDGWAVTFVTPQDATQPYGVVAAAARQLLLADPTTQDKLGPHVRAVLAALTPLPIQAGPLPGPLARHQVVGALHALLVAKRSDAPVLFVVDDADAMDHASADVILQLMATAAPVRTVLALRSTQGQPVLDRGLFRRERTGRLTRIDLEPIAGEEMANIVARALPQDGSAQDIHAIVSAAEGNPFVALELAAAAGKVESGIPVSVRDAITRRLCEVDDDALLALRRLALAPQSFDSAIANAFMGGDEALTFSVLDRALNAAVLGVFDGRYRFRHALVRQALTEQLPPHSRVLVHREVAQRLEALMASMALPPALIAHHWMQASSTHRAAPWLRRAAREAFRIAAFADALASLEPLLSHAPADPEGLGLRAECLDAMGDPRALLAYDEAAAVAETDAAHDLRAKRALAQLKASDPKGALASIEGVRPKSVDGRLAEALTYSGAAALGYGDPAIGTAKSAECRRLALQSGDTGAIVVASWAQAAAAHARGDLHSSVWADLWETHNLPHLAVRVFDGHLCITQRFLYGARPYSEVIAFADALAVEATRLGAARGRAFAITLRGEAKLLSGQLDAAEEDLILGARLHRAIGGATGEALSLQRRAELANLRGHTAQAWSLLNAALEVARHCDIGFHLLDRIYGTRIALAQEPKAALAEIYEGQEAVRGPLETCPGCRITFAVPAALAAARAGELNLATNYANKVEWLAQVVMRLPAWDAALEEVRGQLAAATGDTTQAHRLFNLAAKRFRYAGHPLDAERCSELAR